MNIHTLVIWIIGFLCIGSTVMIGAALAGFSNMFVMVVCLALNVVWFSYMDTLRVEKKRDE